MMRKIERYRFMVTVSYMRGVIPISKEVLFLSKKRNIDIKDLDRLRKQIVCSESMPGMELTPTSINIVNIVKMWIKN